jgi:hypothetical protein
MEKTQKFEEAFKDRREEIKIYAKKCPDMLIGRKIVDLEYGPDANGDPELYYFVLDNGIKIGLARVFVGGKVKELDRKERYSDGTIIRFQFHNWPK